MTVEEYDRLAAFVVGWQTSETAREARARCGAWASATAADLRRKGVPLRHFRPARSSAVDTTFQWNPSYRKLTDLARECRPS